FLTNGGIRLGQNDTYSDGPTVLANGNNKYNEVHHNQCDSTCEITVVFSEGSHLKASYNIGHGSDSPFAILGSWNDVEFSHNVAFDQLNAGRGFEATPNSGSDGYNDLRIIDNYTNNAFANGIHVIGLSGTGFITN